MAATLRTARDVAVAFRRYVDDITPAWLDSGDETNLLWTDDELLQYLNDALSEYSRRVQRRDDTLPAPVPPALADPLSLLDVPVVIGQTEYLLEARIYAVLSAELYGIPLTRLTFRPAVNELATMPVCFGVEGETLYLDARPATAGALRLRVNRLPYRPVRTVTEALPLDCRPEDCQALLHWMAHLAYLKHDADSMDLERADREMLMFDRLIGPRVGAQLERQRREELQGSTVHTRCYE